MGRFDAFVGNTNASVLDRGNDTVRTHRGLLYTSLYPSGDSENGDFALNIGRCSLAQSHAEAMLRCDEDSCVTEKIRKSLSDHRPVAYTSLEHHLIMYGLAQNFPLAVSSSGAFSSATERFLANSSSYPFLQQNGHPTAKESYVDLSVVPPDVFSRRLSLLLNTYYQLSIRPTGYFGSLSTNLSRYGPDTLPSTDLNAYLPANLSATSHSIEEWWPPFRDLVQGTDAPFIGATTMGNVTTVEEIFVCDFAWLALLFASSTIIFITGAIALILKRKTVGPELFGFVTSMTYEKNMSKYLGEEAR